MSVGTEGTAVEPLRFEDGALLVLDQRALPAEERWIRCETVEQVADCIRTLAVRGAPAIGLAAAYALALAEDRVAAAELLRSTRPTAVNLAWALDRCRDAPDVLEAARRLHREQHDADRRLAELGAELFADGTRALTHCNTGALATGGYGTACGVLRAAWERAGWRRCGSTRRVRCFRGRGSPRGSCGSRASPTEWSRTRRRAR
jgi:methylthioribose-1-phosphate isomerase